MKAASSLAVPVALLLLVAGAVAMGVSPVFVRNAEVGPFASAFYRVFLALPVLWVWAHLESRRGGGAALGFSRPVLAAGVLFSLDLLFWHLSIVNTTMANATLMACLAPVWVALFSRAFIGEEVSARTWFGLAFCLAGAALLLGSSYSLAPERLMGDIYGIITSLFFGLYFLAVRVARRTTSGGVVIFQSTIITSAILFVVALVSGDGLVPESATGIASLVALGTISHAGGQGLLAIALGALSAAFSSLVIFVEAIAGAFFGWLIFNETMGPLQLGGALLILLGVFAARPKSS